MGDHQKSARRKNKRRCVHQVDGVSGEHQQQPRGVDQNSTLPHSQPVQFEISSTSTQHQSQHLMKSPNHLPNTGHELPAKKSAAAVKGQPVVTKATLPTALLIESDTAINTNLCKNIPVKALDNKIQTPKKVEIIVQSANDNGNVANEIQRSSLRQTGDVNVKSDNSFPSGKPKTSVENTAVAPTKSKSELRAERRALQEAQRAAKHIKKDEDKGGRSSNVPTMVSVVAKSGSRGVQPKRPPEVIPDKAISTLPNRMKSMAVMNVKLFSHLPAYERRISVIQAAKEGIHPAIVRLGIQYAEGIICGSSARCTALIHAFLEVFRDFKTPESKDLSHALTSLHIEPSMRFIEKCRPASVGMTIICRKLVEEITNLSKELSEEEAKKKLANVLENILEDDIIKSHVAIVNLAKEKITSEDVILTYGCSYIVKEVLTAAHQEAKFRVIVVDARPKLEGRSMLHYLTQQGIQCTYVLINAVAHVMKEATKVFLGAHALLANGFVMSRIGSSQVALVAKAFNKPVLVCCETYKFSELVQTDSIVFNELGNPDDLVETHRNNNPLSGWQEMKGLNILNLYYDVTPPDLVTVIINDAHLVPCTSVPVLLRVKPSKR